MIVCLTGMPGSGKSTAANIFAENGFEVFELSAIIKAEMKRKGIEITNESIERFASRSKLERGKGVFAEMMGQILKEAGDIDALVVGFRSVAEFEAAERAVGSDLPLIEVQTPQKVRFKRLAERRDLPIRSMDVLIMREKSNINMGILELLGRADYVIANSGTEEELRQSIAEIIGKLGEPG